MKRERESKESSLRARVALFEEQGQAMAVRLEDGQAVEWLAMEGDEDVLRLDIHVGILGDIVPALSACFVDIGDEKPGFLPLSEAPANAKSGQPILVQIRRLTGPGKGPMLTARLQLPGPYAVLVQEGQPKTRTLLKTLPPDQQKEAFQRDLERLEKTLQAAQDSMLTGPRPRRLLRPGGFWSQLSCGLIDAQTETVLVEGATLWQQAKAQMKAVMPQKLSLLSTYPPHLEHRLAQAIELPRIKEQKTRKKVYLAGGGFILIEVLETLTVIDVNSGQDLGRSERQSLAAHVNGQAAKLIARQLRLRDLAGMILIDFIGENAAARDAMAQHFKTMTRRDRAVIRHFGFTKMGLYELVRFWP